MNKIDINKIIKHYDSGIGTNRLAEMFNCHRTTIQRLLIKNDVSLRKRSVDFLSDDSFFKSYNKNSCYWAGFIMADGCIRKKQRIVSIKLQIRDRNHLEKLKILSKFEGNVRDYKKLGYSAIDVRNKSWMIDLKRNFLITPRKSHTAKFNINIPRKYLNHFIRGIMDGDGSVSCRVSKNRRNKYLSVSFTGTLNIINNIVKFISEFIDVIIPKIQHPLRENNNYSSISYTCLNAERVLNWIYKGSNDEIRLDRKYEKWINRPITRHYSKTY